MSIVGKPQSKVTEGPVSSKKVLAGI